MSYKTILENQKRIAFCCDWCGYELYYIGPGMPFGWNMILRHIEYNEGTRGYTYHMCNKCTNDILFISKNVHT